MHACKYIYTCAAFWVYMQGNRLIEAGSPSASHMPPAPCCGSSKPQKFSMCLPAAGNVVELILSIAALQAGLYDVVATSLLGSILSNLLLVLGMSFFVGGLK